MEHLLQEVFIDAEDRECLISMLSLRVGQQGHLYPVNVFDADSFLHDEDYELRQFELHFDWDIVDLRLEVVGLDLLTKA